MVSETLRILVDADTTKAEGKFKALSGLASSAALLGFAKQSVDAWEVQATAVAKLDAAVNTHQKNMQGHTSKNLQDIASQTQAMTTYGDEATMIGSENLLTFGATYNQIKSLQKPMADLTAHQKGMHADGKDFLDVTNQIGKAWLNGAGALTKAGTITKAQAKDIDKIKDDNERLAALTKAIESNYGGMASNLAKTDVGKIQKMKNDWGDMQEKIGEKLMPYLIEFGEFVNGHMDQIIQIGTALAAWKIGSGLFSGLNSINRSLGVMETKLGGSGKTSNAMGKTMRGLGGVAGVVGANQVGGIGGAVSGAMSGAVAGAELGSIIPGVGNVVGAVGGGVIGGVIGGWDMISANLHLDGKKVATNTSNHRKTSAGNSHYAN